jgi:DNA-directed RNA polymerase specialized sigma24 family protein
VILKDVLGCSLGEIVEITGATLPGVKAALFRGRASLRARAGESAADREATPAIDASDRTG